ncbi:MAG: hypothetical protein HY962_01220 [Ignavibacteriae bacterium]|nr:hypothetical protein [Ignavibacteriota bacterium]
MLHAAADALAARRQPLRPLAHNPSPRSSNHFRACRAQAVRPVRAARSRFVQQPARLSHVDNPGVHQRSTPLRLRAITAVLAARNR